MHNNQCPMKISVRRQSQYRKVISKQFALGEFLFFSFCSNFSFKLKLDHACFLIHLKMLSLCLQCGKLPFQTWIFINGFLKQDSTSCQREQCMKKKAYFFPLKMCALMIS